MVVDLEEGVLNLIYAFVKGGELDLGVKVKEFNQYPVSKKIIQP